MHAFVKDGQILAVGVSIPREAMTLDGEEMIFNLRTQPEAVQRSCGYWEIVETTPPTVSDTQRADRSVNMVGGVPTEVWTVRNETTEEAVYRTRKQNSLTLRDVQAGLAMLEANKAYLTWYRSTPVQTLINGTGAMTLQQLSDGLRQVAKQEERNVQALNVLIRLQIGDAALDSTSSS